MKSYTLLEALAQYVAEHDDSTLGDSAGLKAALSELAAPDIAITEIKDGRFDVVGPIVPDGLRIYLDERDSPQLVIPADRFPPRLEGSAWHFKPGSPEALALEAASA